MSEEQVEKFDALVKEMLDSNQKGIKLYKKNHFVRMMGHLTPGAKGSRFELDEMFQPYTWGATSTGRYMANNEMTYSHFKGACGVYMIFATRETIDTKLLWFGEFKETDEARIKQCLVGEFIQGGPKEQNFMITGVPLRMCAECNKPLEKSYKCLRCLEKGIHVRYCGKECQRAHWGLHGLVCRLFPNTSPAPPAQARACSTPAHT